MTSNRTAEEWAKIGPELARIVESDWKASDKVTMQALILQARSAPANIRLRVVDNKTIKQVAKAAGLSERTVGDSLQTLASAGIIQKNTDRVAVDREGTPLNHKQKVDFKLGHRWEVATVISFGELPERLPLLSDGTNAKRSKAVAAEQRSKFRKMTEELQRHLDHATCPHCHEAGTLRGKISATCLECGTILTDSELEDALETVSTETANFAVSGDEPEFGPDIYTESNLAESANFAVSTNDDTEARILPDVLLSADFAESEDGNNEERRNGLALQDSHETVTTEIPSSFVDSQAEPVVAVEVLKREILSGRDSIDYAYGIAKPEFRLQDSDKRFVTTWIGDYKVLSTDRVDVGDAKIYVKRPKATVLAQFKPQTFLFLDIDEGFAKALQHPLLKDCPYVFRDMTSGKFFVCVAGDVKTCPKIIANGVELEIKRFGIIAGLHGESGLPYQIMTGNLNTPYDQATIRQIVLDLTGVDYLAKSRKHLPGPKGKAGNSLVEAGIQHFNSDLEHIQYVQDQLSRLRWSGEAVALRTEERTPSTYEIAEGIWHDYGTQETFDVFELWCRFQGLDKSKQIWIAADDYLESKGLARRYGVLEVAI